MARGATRAAEGDSLQSRVPDPDDAHLRSKVKEAVVLPPDVVLKAFRVKKGGLVLKVADVPPGYLARTGRMMLLSLYQVVNLGRLRAAERGA